MVFALLGDQNKQFEDVTLGTYNGHISLFLFKEICKIFVYIQTE